jgi:hypothetical protein
MRRPSFRYVVMFPALASVLLATACSASGGGKLAPYVWASCTPGRTTSGPSTLPIFGFHATATFSQAWVSSFDGNFTDACSQVAFTGSGKLNPVPVPPEMPQYAGGCMGGMPSYTSKDSRHQGTGTFLLITCDLNSRLAPTGGGALAGSSGDYMMINVLSGPYMGYSVVGTVQDGNILVKP